MDLSALVKLSLASRGGPAVPAGPFNGHATLTDSLISYWALSDTSDSVGSNTLTNSGVTFGAGFEGNAGYFTTASNTQLSCAAFLGADAAVSISMWFYLADGASRYTLIDSGGDGNLYTRASAVGGGNLVQIVVRGFADTQTLITPVAATTWHHLVAWHDPVANETGLYFNSISATSATGGVNGTPAAFIMGNRAGNIEPLNGRIDEVAVWSRVLTAGERSDLYNGGVGLFY